MSDYLSHISNDENQQTNLEHLKNTANLCGDFASHFCAKELGMLAGLSHDIGKYSLEFQQRLKNNGKKVDHSTAGAFECCKLKQPYAAYAVIGHHSGLPDGGTFDESTGSTFYARINRASKGELCDYSAWKNELTLPLAYAPNWLSHDQLTDFFFIRMLYSCLVDADFLDTASFMLGEPYISESYSDMEELNRRLDKYIAKWFPPKNELNKKRCDILSSCIECGKNDTSNLFTLTVPTGGGKTVASLAFALKRAIRPDNPKRRIIYVIPYTSIIEQTAKIFRDILGDENVLEHHSGIVYESYDNSDEEEVNANNIQLARATENWDAPIIVTTSVQFFESLYANHSSKCRKLHNIADSIVIFDEAQMLPFPYLRPCIHAISQLIAHYGVVAVMCTATQPILMPFFKEYLPDRISIELCPQKLQDDSVFKRVNFRYAGKISTDSLATKLNEQYQVLCIVNRRADAHQLYDLINAEGRFHLSTLMTSIDRKRVLEKINKRLKSNLPCRVISTSLIEAGVDVDFPTVYREECGLDSIMQAAGRCNREGKRPPENSIVTIYNSEKRPPILFAKSISAARIALEKYSDPSNTEALHTYFEKYLQIKGDESLDQHQILDQIKTLNIPFKTIAKQFHLIENNTHTIYIPIGEGKELINRCRYGEISKTLIRKLGQYSISVYEEHFKALLRANDIEAVTDNIFVLTNESLYNSEIGLSLDADIGKAEFI